MQRIELKSNTKASASRTTEQKSRRNELARKRRAKETVEQKSRRNQLARDKRANESVEERRERLTKRNERDRARRAARIELAPPEATRTQEPNPNITANLAPDFPLLEQHQVQVAMKSFHQEMSTIQTPKCSTCMERFPGIQLNSRGECLRCTRDKHVPKLFSEANNMDPGSTPTELQVS